MIGIIGSGFGLYGYLPALVKFGVDSVALLDRYKEKFHSRPELATLEKNISWVQNENALIKSADGIILSVNPATQDKLLSEILKFESVRFLCIEKPVSLSPSSAQDVLKRLMDSGKTFRIAYTFKYTSWSRRLSEIQAEKRIKKIKIHWIFFAHHYRNNLDNWKRYNDAGGSVLRFYGIHLIAWAAELGYNDIKYSKSSGQSENDIHSWESSLSGKDSTIEILIHSKALDNRFAVEAFSEENGSLKSVFHIDQTDPFVAKGNPAAGIEDSRIGLLVDLIHSMFTPEDNQSVYKNYMNCNTLWAAIEKSNQHQIDQTG